MSACTWKQIGDRVWQCKVCGLRIAAAVKPDGTLLEPQWDKMPPCGWRPRRYELGGHRWVERYTPDGFVPFVCVRCRKTISLSGNAETVLKAQPACANPAPTASPGIVQQGWNYTKAVARWIAAGRPVRSNERVREIFETLCQRCEHFDAGHGSCRLCGCRVRRDGPAFTNKLRMATERCPMNPPKWVEEVHVD